MLKTKPVKILLFVFLLLSGAVFTHQSSFLATDIQPLGKGSVHALSRIYLKWKNDYQSQGGNQFLTIPLRDNKHLSTAHRAKGLIKIDLYTGQYTASIKSNGLAPYYLWLIGKQKAGSEKTISRLLGQLKASGSNLYQLESQLDLAEMQDIYLNRIVIGSNPREAQSSILLSGSPDLFQKTFYLNQYKLVAQLESTAQLSSEKNQPPLFMEQFLPKIAHAKSKNHARDDIFKTQIARGRDLFINETFAGNGRTCSTCHRLDNNHTIDPIYIAQLPDNDPLFIAETNPELATLEQPELLRQFGLIISNIDGFDKPGVLRGVPHLFALGTSITPEEEFEGTVVRHALGWSADGSPGDGSLRSFTIGAVMQHLPKTLSREEGIDFRLPTDDELDALEAYMLSLGRSEDLDLDNMYFSSPIVQKGRELFHSKEPGTGQCKGCHFNAGANSSSSLQNGNRDTGVENMPDNLLKLVWKQTPVDGGFGEYDRDDCGWSTEETCYGNNEFNMTSVVEAADTAPFFHNNSVNTIEEAVAFYNSNAFHASPGANPADPDDPESVCERCIHLEPTQVTAIALFLRTINAMENIRSSNDLDRQARSQRRRQRRELIQFAIAETEDAIEVLEGGAIIPNPESVKLLYKALSYQQKALQNRRTVFARRLLKQAIRAKRQANDLLLGEAPTGEQDQ